MSLRTEKDYIKKVSLGIFELSRHWCERKTIIFQLNTRLRVLCLRLRFCGGNGTGGGWELKVWKSSEIKKTVLFAIFGQSRIRFMVKTKALLNDSSSTNGGCSLETLVGGIIPVITKKWVWLSKQIINFTPFLNWPSGIWSKNQKIWFSTESSSTNVRLSSGTSM